MRKLPSIKPTSEQLPLIGNQAPGVMVIRGAAGSGKTTTALLRLRTLAQYWRSRRKRLELHEPVRVLVLTFNRTLRGYVEALASEQVQTGADLDLTVSTFGRWSRSALRLGSMVEDARRSQVLQKLGSSTSLPGRFLTDEADYALGRFLPSDLEDYIECRRDGRGGSPRVERSLRRTLLRDVFTPYAEWKQARGFVDWNDLAVQLATRRACGPYDVIIVDEAQDFSANQVRAVMNHAADPHSVTFVLDAAQRIYPRFFTWKEVGISLSSAQSHRLANNHRNTAEIACFAHALVQGMSVGDDGTLPDFNACRKRGAKPIVVRGKFSAQTSYAIRFIMNSVDLSNESVLFAHPRGGGWFSHLKQELRRAGLPYVEISRGNDWPDGPENIALSTMSSAKGLEFDHVMILGWSGEATEHGSDSDDTDYENLRRLTAMAITRARLTALLGYKPTEASDQLVGLLDPSSYVGVDV